VETLKSHLLEHGWVRVENVYTTREIDDLVQVVEEHVARAGLDPNDRTHTDVDARGTAAPRKLAFPSLVDDRFMAFACGERMLDLVRELHGGTPMLLMDHVFLKAPDVGGPKYLHQDNYYFHVAPPSMGVTTWVALDDADESNGCLKYVDRSHRLPVQPHGFRPDEPRNAELNVATPTSAVPVPVRRGDVLVHHLHSIHGSGANRTQRWRRAYSMHWLTGEATLDAEPLKHAVFRHAAYPGRAALAHRYPSLFG